MSANNLHIRSSVLDRLIDLEPTASGEPVRFHAATFRELKAAVCRDLENLLNTRNFLSAEVGGFRELSSSLLGYGLRDYTSSNPRSPLLRQQLRQELEKAIGCFEPRLHNVTVRIQDSDGNERNLRFMISGLLLTDSVAEPVTFDTVFDVNRCEYSIPK
jgi:type VI secretion system protein ImpF